MTSNTLFNRVTAMALVWQYGEKSGNDSWKGLSWGMVSNVVHVDLIICIKS